MKTLITFLLAFGFIHCFGSDLWISRPILYMEDGNSFAVFNLYWKNAWNSPINNDAVWLFCKSVPNEGGYRHIKVSDSGHDVVNLFSENDPGLDFKTTEDGMGLFVVPSKEFRGDIEVTLRIMLQPSSFDQIDTRNASFNVYGVEMVKIPTGGFTLGDNDDEALKYGALFQPDEFGNFEGLVRIESEDQELLISETGDLFYHANEGYEGDQKGEIPFSYPKGVQSYYVMKYELSESQYVSFLNTLSVSQLDPRSNVNEEGYDGSIILTEGKYSSMVPNRPCSFMSWDDALAYADWAGLRPMTEFEFTKAARGPSHPETSIYPWGTESKEKVQRLPLTSGALVMVNGWEESRLSSSTKYLFGASYYWVMDLAGSLWERVITIGHENGRLFKGSHGDGVLTDSGFATNEDWPDGTENSGGIGFRGGGFYGYDREYHEFNPFSPISYRPYGGWHGEMRHKAYGTRFVRTVD